MRSFVDQIDWLIVPLLNPDGYEYSRSSPDPEIRLWRKNRSPLQCTQINTGESSILLNLVFTYFNYQKLLELIQLKLFYFKFRAFSTATNPMLSGSRFKS